MVIGIFFAIVFIVLLILFWKFCDDVKGWWSRLCVAAICSLVVSAIIVFCVAKELASIKFLLG